ncbi:hypothetical protein V6Z12_A02G204500 [Gossypium hirsutum]
MGPTSISISIIGPTSISIIARSRRSSILKQNEASSKAKFRIGGMYSYELTKLFQILQTKKQDKQGTTNAGSEKKRCVHCTDICVEIIFGGAMFERNLSLYAYEVLQIFQRLNCNFIFKE